MLSNPVNTIKIITVSRKSLIHTFFNIVYIQQWRIVPRNVRNEIQKVRPRLAATKNYK